MKLLETLLAMDLEWPENTGEFASWNPYAGMEGMVITTDYRPSNPALEEHTRSALGGWNCRAPDDYKVGVVTRSRWILAKDMTEPEVTDEWAARRAAKFPAYWREIPKHWRFIDTYRINKLFAVQDDTGAILHARKKLLVPGVRTGGKSLDKDVREAISTLECLVNN